MGQPPKGLGEEQHNPNQPPVDSMKIKKKAAAVTIGNTKKNLSENLLDVIFRGGSRFNEAWQLMATFENNRAFGRSHYSKTLFESKDGGVDLGSILAMLKAQARVS